MLGWRCASIFSVSRWSVERENVPATESSVGALGRQVWFELNIPSLLLLAANKCPDKALWRKADGFKMRWCAFGKAKHVKWRSRYWQQTTLLWCGAWCFSECFLPQLMCTVILVSTAFWCAFFLSHHCSLHWGQVPFIEDKCRRKCLCWYI